jgi:formate-dependent nitrite reductase cytochrome c552 subunit
MADGVKCFECHATLSKGHSLTEIKKTCVECHEARYGKMTDDWQKEVSDRMGRLRSSIDRLTSQRKMASETEMKKMETLTREVGEALKAVEKDRSKGVHNFQYARELLLKAEEQILSAERSFSKKRD